MKKGFHIKDIVSVLPGMPAAKMTVPCTGPRCAVCTLLGKEGPRIGEFKLGIFTVQYLPLRESPSIPEGLWTLYEVLTPGGQSVRRMISVPIEQDGWNGAAENLNSEQMTALRHAHRDATGRMRLGRVRGLVKSAPLSPTAF